MGNLFTDARCLTVGQEPPDSPGGQAFRVISRVIQRTFIAGHVCLNPYIISGMVTLPWGLLYVSDNE